MKKVFIGIDFSKLKFDAAIYSVDTKAIVSSEVFDNEQSGYVGFFQWVKENTCCQKSEMLFCGEHTGYYSEKSIKNSIFSILFRNFSGYLFMFC